jgi:DNA invertase Pin-like site-specific DNA recombinase
VKERRPGLDALMADAQRGKFDVVVVWRFDRFARSTNQLILALEEFRGLGIDFVSHQEALGYLDGDGPRHVHCHCGHG